MKHAGEFAVGVGLSATASYVWTLIPGNDTFVLASNPLAFLEHYHWGLAAAIAGKRLKRAKPYRRYLYGFGAGMVIIEAASPQPFSIGKPVEQSVPSMLLGLGLSALLL